VLERDIRDPVHLLRKERVAEQDDRMSTFASEQCEARLDLRDRPRLCQHDLHAHLLTGQDQARELGRVRHVVRIQ